MVTEYFFISVAKQRKMKISEWLDYYNVAVKKHKQKLEILKLNTL